MPPTPTHTSRAGDTGWQRDGRPDPDVVAWLIGRVGNLLDPTKGVPAPPDPRDATITHLAALLDGVMQDDPQAIRDAAAWLTVNRPEVDR